MIKSLINSIIHVTQNAAISCYEWIGKNDEYAADKAAVLAMRNSLNDIKFNGRIVIGEGERDKAPMLFIGEKVGGGAGEIIDIAVDPLEGTTLCAKNMQNAVSVIAVGKKGNLLHAPDVYMNKIAIGPNLPKDIINLDDSVKANLENIAKAKKCSTSDLVVTVLKRSRHEELITKIKESGAKVNLISDGDIAAVIETSYGSRKIDAYMGIGGAPEGVLSAAALLTLGGQMVGKLMFENEDERLRAKDMGISDFKKQYVLEDMAKEDVIFCLTGVTNGVIVRGVKKECDHFFTESLILYSGDKNIKKVEFKKYF